MKLVAAFLLMIFGETLSIYTEMQIAKNHSEWRSYFPAMFPWITLAGGSLLLAYAWIYQAIPNIWTVSIISIATIIIAEPLLALLLFGNPPSAGAVIGFILAAAGLAVSILY